MTEQKRSPNRNNASRRPAMNTRDVIKVNSGIDRMFLILVIMLVTIGSLMIFSASYVHAKNEVGDSYHYVFSQIKWLAIGTLVMLFTIHLDYMVIYRFQLVYFIVSMVALGLVFKFGHTVNEATRWFRIGGVNIQPSEFAKLAVIIFFAKHISLRRFEGRSAFVQIAPYAITLLYCAIVLYLQPHISCIIIIAGLLFVFMLLGDVPIKHLLLLGAVMLVAVAGFIYFSNHGMGRLQVWFHPEEHLKDGGWQPVQSMLAIGSGGFWGVGLGQSTQKHLYLPEPQNDYIFAIICEEMGFVFAVFIIVLFMLLIWRGLYIAKKAPDTFSSLLVIGIIAHVAIQMLLNIAVVTNTLPSTGISLPFFSYGGTALMVFMAEMGIVLNVSKVSYTPKG